MIVPAYRIAYFSFIHPTHKIYLPTLLMSPLIITSGGFLTFHIVFKVISFRKYSVILHLCCAYHLLRQLSVSLSPLDVQDLTKSGTVCKHIGRGNIIFILNWEG